MVDQRMATSVPGVFAAGDAAEHLEITTGMWPIAVEQGTIAGINAVGGDALYQPHPSPALLKGAGLAVQSMGIIDPAPGDEVELEDAGETETRYRKVVSRDRRPIGAVLVGDWPDVAELATAIQNTSMLAGQTAFATRPKPVFTQVRGSTGRS
jgi:nitrite reductase (NADH) large subunit